MDSNETTLCPLCRNETVKIFAFGECAHPVCHLCSTKMRILCGQTYCAICRQDLPQVYFVSDYAQIRFPIDQTRFKPIDETGDCGIYYSSKAEWIRRESEKLLRNFCPFCHSEYETFEILRDHVRRQHRCFYCDLCVEHLNLFPFERKCYTRQDLVQHIRQGDRDDTSFKGHPLCKFCDDHFLDVDHLYKHMRQEHYYCHLCTSDNVYYSNFDLLRDHYRKSHYLCEISQCKNVQFTNVFATEFEFRAHQAAQHSKSRAEARQLGTIPVEFQSATVRDRRQQRDTSNKETNNVVEIKSENENQSSRRDRDENSAATASVPHIDEFPTLSGQALLAQSSTQQRGAWSNDITRGVYSNADFPALSNGNLGVPNSNVSRPKGIWRESQQQQQTSQSGSFSSLLANQVTTNKSTPTAKPTTHVQEDFPELKSSRSGRVPPPESMFSAWTNVKKSSKQNSTMTKPYRPQTRMNTNRIINEDENDDEYVRRPISALTTSTTPMASSNITMISASQLNATQPSDKINQNQSIPKPQDFPELPTTSVRVQNNTTQPSGAWSAGGTKSIATNQQKKKKSNLSKKQFIEEVQQMPSVSVPTSNSDAPPMRLSELGRLLIQEENEVEEKSQDATTSSTTMASSNDKDAQSIDASKKNRKTNQIKDKNKTVEQQSDKIPEKSLSTTKINETSSLLPKQQELVLLPETVTPPPPVSSTVQAPPGFPTAIAVSPPPGFSLFVSSQSLEHCYIHPPSYSQQQDEFRAKLYKLFDDDMNLLVEYDKFCQAFYQDAISTSDFIKFTKELFNDKLEEYLLELVVLVPDIKRQIDLYTIWTKEIQTKPATAVRNWAQKNLDKKSIYQCHLCQQIMFDSDSEVHNSHHPQFNAEFPSLPAASINLGRGRGKQNK